MDRSYWNEIVERKRIGILASFMRFALRALSLLYRLGAALRNTAYDTGLVRSRRLPRPAVSVGNIVAGGVGKSPFVQFLAAELQRRGKRVAILSRGYGGTARARPLLVSDGARVLRTAAEGGDEPVMLAMGVPGAIVAADPDRLRAARMVAGQFGVDLFILDDAFQHRRAAREADILLLDSSRPFGNGRLLPAGQLREPAKNIARANLIVLTRCASPPPPDLIAELNRLNPTAPVFTARHKVAKVRVLASGGGGDVRSLRGKRVAAFSAIARPDDFEATLSDCGAIPVSRRSFPDHHRFRAAEIAEIYAEASRRGAEAVVTTAKDAVRLPDSREHPLPLLCLEIEIEIGGGADKLIECVLALLAKEQF